MRETSYKDAVLITNPKLPTLLAHAFSPSPQKYADLPPCRFHNTIFFPATNKIKIDVSINMNV
jgi:hypothetical protein